MLDGVKFDKHHELWKFWDRTDRWDKVNDRPTYQDQKNCIVIQPNGDEMESWNCGEGGYFVCIHGDDIPRVDVGNGANDYACHLNMSLKVRW